MRQTTGTTKASGVPRPERRGLRPRTTLSALCEASVLITVCARGDCGDPVTVACAVHARLSACLPVASTSTPHAHGVLVCIVMGTGRGCNMRTLRAHDTSTHTRGARGARAEFVLFVNRLPIVVTPSFDAHARALLRGSRARWRRHRSR